MIVRYRSTEEDARKAYYEGLRRAENFGATMVRLAIATIPAFFVWKSLLPPVDLAPGPVSLGLLFGGLVALSIAFYSLILGWNWFAYRLIFRHQLRSGYFSKMIGELEVALGEDGITETYPNGSIQTAWPGVEAVVREDDYLWIKLSSQYAHMIPWSAFATPDEAEAFAAYAEDLCAAHSG